VAARVCRNCRDILVDADKVLREAKLSKHCHIMGPEELRMTPKKDKRGVEYLEVKYFDSDANSLQEIFYFDSHRNRTKFEIDFLRTHLKLPEKKLKFSKIEDVCQHQNLFRSPKFIVARKKDQFWKITEKVFVEELTSSMS
jgi:DNA repair protein RadD